MEMEADTKNEGTEKPFCNERFFSALDCMHHYFAYCSSFLPDVRISTSGLSL